MRRSVEEGRFAVIELCNVEELCATGDPQIWLEWRGQDGKRLGSLGNRTEDDNSMGKCVACGYF